MGLQLCLSLSLCLQLRLRLSLLLRLRLCLQLGLLLRLRLSLQLGLLLRLRLGLQLGLLLRLRLGLQLGLFLRCLRIARRWRIVLPHCSSGRRNRHRVRSSGGNRRARRCRMLESRRDRTDRRTRHHLFDVRGLIVELMQQHEAAEQHRERDERQPGTSAQAPMPRTAGQRRRGGACRQAPAAGRREQRHGPRRSRQLDALQVGGRGLRCSGCRIRASACGRVGAQRHPRTRTTMRTEGNWLEQQSAAAFARDGKNRIRSGLARHRRTLG
ncbi:hypothetical protein FAZ95_32770 [Trinickia violacea]|uniref:Uncharacterized protein n=1 Tax=Trinickia violacea TaxID=2571746 RepID=A0A4P8J1E0_9BURK|nr:hypothetical protein FAZ95_32770 [Trinickia violacea]